MKYFTIWLISLSVTVIILCKVRLSVKLGYLWQKTVSCSEEFEASVVSICEYSENCAFTPTDESGKYGGCPRVYN